MSYDSSCSNVDVEVLEQYNQLCYDFGSDPCAGPPLENCKQGLSWTVDNESTTISDDYECRTPEEQGWTQYHTDIESCYPIYNGPNVTRFEVGRYNFPRCDASLQGEHWCVGVSDFSPSLCLGCEVFLYACQ